MDLLVLNENFETIFVLDTYESLIWVDKFAEPGTFEIYTRVTDDIVNYCKPNYYLVNNDSEHVMIIEDISIESNVETGDKIKIVGRSLESILDRRIVWSQTNIDGNLQSGVQTLINNAIISPSIAGRAISNFIFEQAPQTETAITALEMEHQYTGDNLLEVITSLCEEKKIGFKITLNDQNQFVFRLYSGVDRSYAQDTLPYVVFSPSYDNVINSNFLEKNSITKNVALVGGEGEGTSRITETVGTETGLLRREVFVDARDIRKESLNPTKYKAKLASKGKDSLAEINKDRESFDGKCDTTLGLYVYGRDFFMGDIVQMANEYGMEASSRITEFTWSYSTSGFETYPTFEPVENSTT